MPVMMRYAKKIGFTDKPNHRKLHMSPTPLIGGVVMFISFFISFFIFNKGLDYQDFAVFAASVLIMAIGILDDYYKTKGNDLSALPKILVQVAAATIVFFAGYAFHGFSNPFSSKIITFPNWLQYIFTILWIFGVTTVVNFSDGLDGLAGGISAICASALFIVAITTGQGSPALMAAMLIGSILGFLKYNSHPAKVFMGDSGATFLGFFLAVISLEGVFKQATLISLFIPVLALGVPIFDNIYVVLRRFKEKKPVYKADRMQIHYRLMHSGLSVKQVNAFIYLISTCLCLVSIILLIINSGIMVSAQS
ncbi:MAG: undecaprenyl/decaprenyl-phosphate alpha-N-acetylglucosaminyl 1-phosphate transferase [Clostridiales bacterium]|nr:undecaprenyl/decaprenyl-phosphate alpha-N-acetylglucosaminyl 1-phosphate transferase [Clostridiales bacterium]